MKKRQITRWLVAAGLAAAALSPSLQAQSSDSLLDKLVDKGILTVKEANDLKEEADKNFNTAYQVKSGTPDWVNGMRLYGDVRGRYEGIYGDNTFVDRNRFRYRLRLGVAATLKDDFEVGMRLSSDENASGNSGLGGDPISGNTTMSGNGSKKAIFLDLAYAKWNPVHNSDWYANFAIGKIENPFVVSDMIFDADYTPEGLAQQFAYNITPDQTLRLNLGEFAINEQKSSNKDAFLFGAQLRYDATWSPKLQSSLGVTALALTDPGTLTEAPGANSVVPNQNVGNLRDAAGNLTHQYNPIVVDGSLTYSLESFPLYTGAFPIKVAGDFMHNPDGGNANEGFSAGVTFGKSGKKGLWDLSYRYKYLEGDAWFEELVDSDFGAVYSSAYRGGSKNGYSAGTNIRGHIIKATYSPYDSMTIGITYFLTEVIDLPAPNPKIDTGRLQADVSWKF